MRGTTVKIAAAVAVAAAALTGCGGGPVKMGSAALVGDDRITVTALDQAVQDWQREFKADPTANQMRADPNNPQQQLNSDTLSESDMRGALAVLVNFRVAAEVAKRGGVQVNGGHIDQVMAAMNQQGGAESTTLANGLPKSYTRDLARFLATRALVAQRLGADGNAQSPASAQAQRQAATLFVRTADEMDITINPRFGTFDPQQVSIAPVKYTLSATESGIR